MMMNHYTRQSVGAVSLWSTKLVITVKHLPYKEILIQLKLPTLKYRRKRGDMIEVYKILTNKYDSTVILNLQQSRNSITTGHKVR